MTSAKFTSTAMWRVCRLICPTLLGLLPALTIAQTVPPGYEIVDITSNNGRLEQFPRINNNGQVVFGSRFFPQNTEADIWLYHGRTGELTQITDDGPNDVYDGLPDIADDGTIVWSRWMGEGSTPEIMLRTPDGVVTRITNDPAEDWSPAVNNRQQVVWQKTGAWVCGGPVKDIYFYDHGTGETVAITNNGGPESLENQAADINDSGDIAWTEYDFCDPPFPYNFQSRMMLYSNGQTRVLPTLSVTAQVPSINNQGWIVWNGLDLATRRDTVEFWNGFETVQLTDDGGLPHINNVGDIVFDRWNSNVQRWEVWLFRNDNFLPISHYPNHNITPRINDRGEIAWSTGAMLVATDIRLMRRFQLGDLNCDGAYGAFDIEPFIVALMDPIRYRQLHPACDPALADINEDGAVDGFDIEPFVTLLGGRP